MTARKLPPWPDWAGARARCAICLRPIATEDDEAIWQAAESPDDIPPDWGGVDAPALCWSRFGGDCWAPEWWENVTPLDYLRATGEA